MSILQLIINLIGQHLFLGISLSMIVWFFEKKFPAREIINYGEYQQDFFGLFLIYFISIFYLYFIFKYPNIPINLGTKDFFARLPIWLLIPLVSLSSDFLYYLAHRILHLPSMIKFHSWHHSPDKLFWASGFRGGVVHIFLLSGLLFFFVFISGNNPIVMMTLTLQGIFVQIVSHANFNINFKWPSYFIILPQTHRIHHASDFNLNSKNIGFFWVFWDKIFKTYIDPFELKDNYSLGFKSKKATKLQDLIFR
jgi:sterol desaturase/sphingolipid hydroxylase (fatty acid hydroxylase superfamily)